MSEEVTKPILAKSAASASDMERLANELLLAQGKPAFKASAKPEEKIAYDASAISEALSAPVETFDEPDMVEVSSNEEVLESNVSEVKEALVIPVPEGNYPCICPCKCGSDSLISKSMSVILSYHARCRKCSGQKHMKENPIISLEKSDALEKRGFITIKHAKSEAEVRDERRAYDEVQKEIREVQLERWLNTLPEKFRSAHTDNPKVLDRLKLIEDGKMGVASLIAFGPPGVGKTWLGIAYANTVINAGYLKPSEVIFGSEADLLASAANAPYAEVGKAFHKLTSGNYKMIVIDDVGRAPWLREDMRPKVWSLVLDSLYADNRMVVITTNLTTEDLSTHIGAGAMDRLRSMTGYKLIVLKDEKRKQITEETLNGAPITKK